MATLIQPYRFAAPASLNVGFNFRATSGYVSDPANTTYEIGTGINYPRSILGVTCGWEVAPTSTRDRSLSVDARLAGLHFRAYAVGYTPTYRIDVPAGTYNLSMAMGDTAAGQIGSKVEVYDDATLRLTVWDSAAALSSSYFMDATSVVHTSSANWVANQTPSSVVISSGILRLKLLQTVGGVASTVLNHVRVYS